MNYDSTADTLQHIKRVNSLLITVAQELLQRANIHDDSKLVAPEKEGFDRMTPILKDLKYGSEEYKNSLAELQITLKHHYENNSHHPEHYKEGINDMDLFDVIEMLMDWKAATERTKDGNIYKSLEFNSDRFGISPQLNLIMENTAKKMGF